MQGTKAYGFYDTDVVFQINIPATPTNGFAAYGTRSFGIADFDNLKIQSSAGLKLIDYPTVENNFGYNDALSRL